MKTNKKQLEAMMRAIMNSLANSTSLPDKTTRIIIDNLKLFDKKIKEVNDKICKLPGFDKYVELQEVELKYFCEKYNIKNGQVPQQYQQDWQRALQRCAEKNPEISGAILLEETKEFEIDIQIISDLTGIAPVFILNLPELFNI